MIKLKQVERQDDKVKNELCISNGLNWFGTVPYGRLSW
jgi:hypothetical protein